MQKLSLRGIARRLRADEGSALIAGIGMSVAMMITATSMIESATSNQHSSVRSLADQNAYALAEAGLNNDVAVLGQPTNNPFDPTLLPPRTTQYSTGTVTWWGVLDRANAVWTIYANGQTTTTPSQALARRNVSGKVRIAPVFTQPQPNRAWDYVYTTHTGSTCDETVSSKTVVSSPVYANGNVCLSSGSVIAAGPLVVKGKVSLSALDSSVGTVAAPLTATHIGAGCKYYTYVLHLACSAADNVFAATNDQTIPVIAMPVPDWNTWYRNGMPGPTQACTTATANAPVFENELVNPTRNNSVPTPFSLTPLLSYTCRVGPADAPSGELSWDAGTRTLTVKGTIFIDGSAKADNGLVNLYQGQGTLYLSGTFLVTGPTKLCGKVTATDCDVAWSANDAMLVVVANGSGGQVPAGDSISLGASASFQGGLFATMAVQLGAAAQTKGPMIASTVLFGSASVAYAFAPNVTSPTGTPEAEVSFGRVLSPTGFSG
jgi:hypothetical protein